jgi:starch synthase
MEAYGRLNLLKGGLVYCDAVSTVSPRYAQEITTPEFGCRLEGVLQHRGNELSGIINGVDYGVWNPERDRFLPKAYGPQNVREGKAAAKAALQKKLGLDVRPDAPLLGLIGRLVEQKGVDLVLAVMEERARTDDAQWAILGGDGDPRLGEQLQSLARRYPQKVAARIEKSEELAHLIEAAADVFLMPSRFEPCGLNQLYSLKYGTLPLVHAVGGLADSAANRHGARLVVGPQRERLCRAVSAHDRQSPQRRDGGRVSEWSIVETRFSIAG